MHSKKMGLLAVLFAAVLVTPIFATVYANVYVPPGPRDSMSEWISPTLGVWTVNCKGYADDPVGWYYSDGPMYNFANQQCLPKISMCEPFVPDCNKLCLKYGDPVMILGFFPGVTVSWDQKCPDVELKIVWNGIPNTITLSLPSNEIVGTAYPPTFYNDISTPYQFAIVPKTGPLSYMKNATYNLWDGPAALVLQHLFGVCIPSDYFLSRYGSLSGLWFWYKFYPNMGNSISYDCQSKILSPTYDITALIEQPTTQIWTNHVNFDVKFLELHKTVVTSDTAKPAIVGTATTTSLVDQLLIENVGCVTATGLTVTQTFPRDDKAYVTPSSFTIVKTSECKGILAEASISGAFAFAYPNVLALKSVNAAFDSLKPGEEITITGTCTFSNIPKSDGSQFQGTLVFDSMLGANEVPAWKDPIGLYSVVVGKPSGSTFPLFKAPQLMYVDNDARYDWVFECDPEWFVTCPILRTELDLASPVFTLDPPPVPVTTSVTITAADVSMVRQVIVGKAPYDARMDLFGTGRITLQDLAEYKHAAGV